MQQSACSYQRRRLQLSHLLWRWQREGFLSALDDLGNTPSKSCISRWGHYSWRMDLVRTGQHYFITQHHDQLGPYWSSPLNKPHAHAVNPYTVEEYFDILRDTQAEHKIPDELCYRVDETGIQSGVGITEYVLGPRGQSVQHQQQSSN
jgi:hypothetical protein